MYGFGVCVCVCFMRGFTGYRFFLSKRAEALSASRKG